MTLSEAVAQRIKSILKERNMSQYQLCKEGGIPRSTVFVLSEAKYKTVKLDTVYQIVATLGMSLTEFFDDPIFNNLQD